MPVPQPLPWPQACVALARCVVWTVVALIGGRLHQPHGNVDRTVRFSDGTTGRVYRETVADVDELVEPVTLVVGFRLRRVGGNRMAHRLFRCESIFNTILFAGFPGFVSKLWIADDEDQLYRGVYEWDGGDRANAYVRALWWPLMVISERSSIRFHVIPGRRDCTLAHPEQVPDTEQWWRPTGAMRSL